MKNSKGQTALILILLTAAALIFYAISLNWGHIAQDKSLLTVAADQGASMLASQAASYGQMWKMQDLSNSNQSTKWNGIIIQMVLVMVAIAILIIIEVLSYGGATPFVVAMAIIAIGFAVANLVLQATVVQPGIQSMWNKLQQEQPQKEQFYEQGISTAFAASLTDTAILTDYFDSNANGLFGLTSAGASNDTIGRFAFFYTERLKMFNQSNQVPQIQTFYNGLDQFMNGQTCVENEQANQAEIQKGDYSTMDPSCLMCPPGSFDPTNNNMECSSQCSGGADPSGNPCEPCASNCITSGGASASPLPCIASPLHPVAHPTYPGCSTLIPDGFQLNDPCPAITNPSDSNYNPYCDPCCQTYYGHQDLLFNSASPDHKTPFVVLRSDSCDPPANPGSCNFTWECMTEDKCSDAKDQGCVVSSLLAPGPETSGYQQCVTNNPYGLSSPTMANYPYLYDPAYQNYKMGISFLDQFGRDQQIGTPPFTLNPLGDFPNGVYPFFWFMKDFSPQVDNMTPTTATSNPSQYHWCVAGPTGATSWGAPIVNIPAFPPASGPDPTTAFPDLGQLVLSDPYGTGDPDGYWGYQCQGPDCCVNYLADTVVNNAPAPSNPSVVLNANGVIDMVGDPNFALNPTMYNPNPALDFRFGERPADAASPYQWIEGDNQFCSTVWPYNGDTILGGTCELTDSTSSTASINPTMDSLDNTMRTLSDFVNFANAFLSQDVMDLTKNFHTWYPQVAGWIAPACGGVIKDPACNETCGTGEKCVKGTGGVSGSCESVATGESTGASCGGSDGRLVPLYDPYYQSTSNPSFCLDANGNTCRQGPGCPCTWDLLRQWIGVITNWLKTNYTSPSAWCVPPEGSLYANQTASPTSQYTSCTDTNGDTCSLPKACSSETSCAPPSTCGQTSCTCTCNINGVPTPGTACTCTNETDEHAYISSTGPENDDQIINNNPNFTPTWGDLGYVLACLDYNSYDPLNGDTAPAMTNGSVYNYYQCYADLNNLQPDPNCSTDNNPDPNCYLKCDSTLPYGLPAGQLAADCSPTQLGRTLLNPNGPTGEPEPTHWDATKATACADASTILTGDKTSFEQWVQDSLTLAMDEGPKFALRNNFLNDIYAGTTNSQGATIMQGAATMQTAFQQGDAALSTFFAPCQSTDTACESGGPAAQLMWARLQPLPAESFPNSVIYGWKDNPPTNGAGACADSSNPGGGCSHIVKVTAFSPGRCSGGSTYNSICYSGNQKYNSGKLQIFSSLPNINDNGGNTALGAGLFLGLGAVGLAIDFAFNIGTTNTYTLTQRDGDVYLSVERWDQPHSNLANPNNPAIPFPNKLPLWQFSFNNPTQSPQNVGDLWTNCAPLSLGGGNVGFGLTIQMVNALNNYSSETMGSHILATDVTALGNAFMLNDEGDGCGTVDSLTASSCGNLTSYRTCLNAANALLTTGVESHACARYVATDKPNDVNSKLGAKNYKVIFIKCPSIPPDDLLQQGSGSMSCPNGDAPLSCPGTS